MKFFNLDNAFKQLNTHLKIAKSHQLTSKLLSLINMNFYSIFESCNHVLRKLPQWQKKACDQTPRHTT